MLVAVAVVLPLLAGMFYVVRRAVAWLLGSDGLRRRPPPTRTDPQLYCCDPTPRITFTRISANGATSVEYRPGRSSIGETIDVRRALAAKASGDGVDSNSDHAQKSAVPSALPDPFNYFPRQSPSVERPAWPGPSYRAGSYATPFRRPDGFVPDSPPAVACVDSSSSRRRLVHAERHHNALRQRSSPPSMSASRRKRPAHSASDPYKMPRLSISSSKRSAASDEHHPDPANKRSKKSNQYRSLDHFDLAEELRDRADSLSENRLPRRSSLSSPVSSPESVALNSEFNEFEMQDELTIEMPAESVLDSVSRDAESDRYRPVKGPNFESARKTIPEDSEPDLPHSDIFNNHRRISRVYPRRQFALDDMLFDDEEIRLKFQRNDKEVLDILQSYAS